MKAGKLCFMAMLLGFALVIFVLEAQIPPLLPIPGIKLGLANVITLISMYMLGRREAFVILVLRIVLSAVFSGNMAGFIYSIAGGLTAFFVMAAAKIIIQENNMWAASVLGAMGHNTAQIAAACFIMKSPYLIWYLPVLMISAVVTGVFTGLAAQLTYKRLEKTGIFKENTNA